MCLKLKTFGTFYVRPIAITPVGIFMLFSIQLEKLILKFSVCTELLTLKYKMVARDSMLEGPDINLLI